MKRILSVFLALAATAAFATDKRAPRNRSSGGKTCLQTSVSGTLTDGLCITGTATVDPVGGFGTTTDGAASASLSGIVTTAAQTFAGNKTFNGVVDASASAGGVKVETARASPASGDSQNVYAGTYTPTFSRTGATFTIRGFQWYRVGNLVTVFGYADESSGGSTNDLFMTLPITPATFSATDAIARSQVQGSFIVDNNGNVTIKGEPGGTRLQADGAALTNVGNGLRIQISYRL